MSFDYSTIWAPCYRGPVENTAFTLYAMEKEGQLPTRQGKINQVINKLVAAGPLRCNDFSVQCRIYDEVGIDSDTFTVEEMRYIEREVAKRL